MKISRTFYEPLVCLVKNPFRKKKKIFSENIFSRKTKVIKHFNFCKVSQPASHLSRSQGTTGVKQKKLQNETKFWKP